MSNKQYAISNLKQNLAYVEGDLKSALNNAKEIGDKELTEKLTSIQTATVGVKDYLKDRTEQVAKEAAGED